MKDLENLARDIGNAPKVRDEIVWRFKGNKGWRVGIVQAVMAGYRIVEIREGAWPADRVALDDIDWHRK